MRDLGIYTEVLDDNITFRRFLRLFAMLSAPSHHTLQFQYPI